MMLFSGDVVKLKCCGSRGTILYAACLDRLDLGEVDCKVKYMNLHNNIVKVDNVSDIDSITLVGNVKSLYGRIKCYIAGLPSNKSKALLNEMRHLVSNKGKGVISSDTNNSDLNDIANVIGCDPLVCSCIYLERSVIFDLTERSVEHSTSSVINNDYL